MDLVSRFILHVENYFLLSEISKMIIQWSLTALIIFAFVLLFLADKSKPTFSLIVGLAIRIVLLIGLSIEMFHQVKVTELTQVFGNKMNSYRQFLHFMFFGYIIVVGFYYIVTIYQKKLKGIFYTFDIAVLSMPILQLVTSFIIFMKKEEALVEDFIVLFIILFLTLALLFIFFKCYWEPKKRLLIPFYFVISICLLTLVSGSPVVELNEIVNLYIFLGLLMTYHLLSLTEISIVKRGKKPFVIILAVIFLIIINPLYNIGNLALANTNAELRLRYFDSTNLVTLNESEEIAKTLTGDHKFFFKQNSHEDFHNVYFLESENYEISIDGISGMVTNLHRKTEPTGTTLKREEYIGKSKKVLEKIGRTLKEDQIKTKVIEKGDVFEVKMVPLLTDGTTMEDQWETVFTWEKEALIEFHEMTILYPLESLKDIEVTDQMIDQKIDEFFKILGQEKPVYVLTDIVYGYSNRSIDLHINTKDNNHLLLDGKTGEVKDFIGILAANNDLDFTRIEDKLFQSYGINKEDYERFRQDSSWVWRAREDNKSIQEYTYRIGYTEGDPSFSFSKSIDYLMDFTSDTKNRTRELAYEAVEKLNKDQRIYARRAKLTQVIDEKDRIREAWLVVIQPFGKAEHHLYLVDVETQKVDVLYE